MNQRFTDLILAAIKQRLSDLHITGGFPLIFRRDGVIHFDKNIKWSHTEIDAMVKEMLSDRQLQMLRKRWSVDFALSFNHVRVRINAFYTTRGLSLAIRLLPETIPDLTSLNLHPSLNQIVELQSGLILVCGSTGFGKSTTIAAIIEEINRTRPTHIITIEDPIEFVHQSHGCIINQREVGTHTRSFAAALRGALREDPDIILVGEMRDLETISLAVEAASTGHLVFATVHTTSAAKTVDRVIEVFPASEQLQIRSTLADGLRAVISQILFKRIDIKARGVALEILIATSAVRNLIRESKTYQIPSMMQTGKKYGMQLMDDGIMDLYTRGWISSDDAYIKANDKARFRPLLKYPPTDFTEA